LLVAAAALLAPRAAHAHPIHLAHANVTLQRDTARLEIELRVIADDLLAALNTGRAQPLSYEKSPAAELDAALRAYVLANFSLTARDATAPIVLSWIGREADTEGPHQRLWLYFEAPFPDELDGARLRHALLFATIDRQENTARIRDGSRDLTLRFIPGEDAKVIRFAPVP
jgi:hypothetical protein